MEIIRFIIFQNLLICSTKLYKPTDLLYYMLYKILSLYDIVYIKHRSFQVIRSILILQSKILLCDDKQVCNVTFYES